MKLVDTYTKDAMSGTYLYELETDGLRWEVTCWEYAEEDEYYEHRWSVDSIVLSEDGTRRAFTEEEARKEFDRRRR